MRSNADGFLPDAGAFLEHGPDMALSRWLRSALMPSCPSRRPGPTLYKGYRFPPAIISYCVWLYYRFGVSLRDVSELMLARGIEVSHEAIRLWTLRFGAEYARRLRRTRGACSDIGTSMNSV